MTKLEAQEYGHYLVKVLEEKGYSLSWLMRHPQKEKINARIERAFYEQMKKGK